MKNLQRRRKEANLSRFELAVKAGVSPDTIEAIEIGRSDGNIKTARKLAKALGTTVSDLLGERATA